MHLYGPWILDACLLQIKDRFSRSSTTNESKSFHFPCSINPIDLLAIRMNDQTDIQVRKSSLLFTGFLIDRLLE